MYCHFTKKYKIQQYSYVVTVIYPARPNSEDLITDRSLYLKTINPIPTDFLGESR